MDDLVRQAGPVLGTIGIIAGMVVLAVVWNVSEDRRRANRPSPPADRYQCADCGLIFSQHHVSGCQRTFPYGWTGRCIVCRRYCSMHPVRACAAFRDRYPTPSRGTPPGR